MKWPCTRLCWTAARRPTGKGRYSYQTHASLVGMVYCLMEPLCFKFSFSHIAKQNKKIHNFVWFVLGGWSWIWGEGPPEQNTAKKDHQETMFKGPRKAVVGYKIDPNRFKTTYRSVLTFEEKKQSITHLFKTFTGLRLVCNAPILAER